MPLEEGAAGPSPTHFDLTDFENSDDDANFLSKGKKIASLFEDIDMDVSLAKRLFLAEGEIISWQDDYSGKRFFPSFTDVRVCFQGEEVVHEIYREAARQTKLLLEQLTHGTALALNQELSEGSNSAQSIIHYDIHSEAKNEGPQYKGWVEGGSDEDLVVLRAKVRGENAWQPSEGEDDEPLVQAYDQGITIAANLNEERVEVRVDLKVAFPKTSSHKEWNSRLDGSFYLAPDENGRPMLKQEFKVTIFEAGELWEGSFSGGAQTNNSGDVVVEMAASSEGAESKYGFKMGKSSNGRCRISQLVNEARPELLDAWLNGMSQ
jgi:hypothetical protein